MLLLLSSSITSTSNYYCTYNVRRTSYIPWLHAQIPDRENRRFFQIFSFQFFFSLNPHWLISPNTRVEHKTKYWFSLMVFFNLQLNFSDNFVDSERPKKLKSCKLWAQLKTTWYCPKGLKIGHMSFDMHWRDVSFKFRAKKKKLT